MLILTNPLKILLKTRKALFSKNYKTAKRVQALSAKGEFDQGKRIND